MSGIDKNKESLLATQLVAGTQKHLSLATQLFVDGDTLTAAETAAKLERFAKARRDVDAARAALAAALVDEKTIRRELRPFVVSFMGLVQVAFRTKPDVLADFGLAPKKARKPLTAEAQNLAIAKRASTREARGTMGKRKKLAIKGNVTGVVIAPITEHSPPLR